MSFLRSSATSLLDRLGVSVVRRESLALLNDAFRWRALPPLLLAGGNWSSGELRPLLSGSKSQFLQDLFVALTLQLKRGGVFVEFGATDGVTLSNTHLLEHALGWTGVLAEPSRQFHEALQANRRCRIDTRCVYRESGRTVSFDEIAGTGVSQVSDYRGSDKLSGLRRGRVRYAVETVSFNDLVSQHGLPREIDYVSMDVEGGEYDILAGIDFSRIDIRVLTVEHNFSAQREKIHALLSREGYQRVHADISYTDDWYVRDGI